jgi:hypothetical protein
MKRRILSILIIGLFMGMVIFAFEGAASTQIFIPGSPTPPTAEELKAMENAPIGEPLIPSSGRGWFVNPNPRTYSPPALGKIITPTQDLTEDFLTP